MHFEWRKDSTFILRQKRKLRIIPMDQCGYFPFHDGKHLNIFFGSGYNKPILHDARYNLIRNWTEGVDIPWSFNIDASVVQIMNYLWIVGGSKACSKGLKMNYVKNYGRCVLSLISMVNSIFQVYPPMMYICRLSSFDKPGVLEISKKSTFWERGSKKSKKLSNWLVNGSLCQGGDPFQIHFNLHDIYLFYSLKSHSCKNPKDRQIHTCGLFQKMYG